MSEHPVRKKPCPYCEKRLQAKSKGQWRNNLARHLQNCVPYKITVEPRLRLEAAAFFGGIVGQLIAAGGGKFEGEDLKSIEVPSNIAELERLAKLEDPRNV